jgi:site-specific recombinase XerD
MATMTAPAAEPTEQLTLFDLGVSVGNLRKRATELRQTHTRAAATRHAYDCDWRDFSAWCTEVGRGSLPATADTVRLYLVDQLQTWKLSTVERRLAAICSMHRDSGHEPPHDRDTRELLKAARRAHGAPPASKAALSVDHLKQIIKTMPKGVVGTRDKAVLLMGFASGLRRSELVRLNVEDVEISPKGMLVTVRKSKTDQEGKGRQMGIPPAKNKALCPVAAVMQWLWLSGKGKGPLLCSLGPMCEITNNRLSAKGVAAIVKHHVERIGLDAARYAAHSLRAGMVTAALEAGVPESVVMLRSGHKSVLVLHRYLRPATVWATNPLAKVL